MSSSPPNQATSRADCLASIDVAVLAGGLGTRLRSVLGETPKILAPVAGRPFLDHLLTWLASFGARRVVLCLGVRADLVTEHLARHPFPGVDVVASIEPEPLGTAGGLRLAAPLLHSDPVLVMNGDTFVDVDLADFVAKHRAQAAAASMLCAHVPSMARYGRVDVDASGRIQRYAEKDPSDTGPGLISAGSYLFSQRWLADFARGTGPSLERDVFAKAPPGSLHAVAVTGATFLDIGTPETFAEAEAVILHAVGRPGLGRGATRDAITRSVA